MKNKNEDILQVCHVTKEFEKSTHFWQREEYFTAVRDVSFFVGKGEILGLLGESGCGKSTLSKMITGLTKPSSGKIIYKGTELQNLSQAAYKPYRREIQMIFQNPFGSLDPRMKIRQQLLEPLKIWKIGNDETQRLEMIKGMCEECGLAEECFEKRPGEFSGGQLQRIAIVRALLLHPGFLIADEIVSALDVPVQNQILELLLKMREKYGLTLLFITHDIAVMRKVADRLIVMKEGRFLGEGTYEELLAEQKEGYIRDLIGASFIFKP